ncbi:MAG: hypothetical protein K2X38_13275 [Gemmataceae bacterium]|nr:hypothetical protein [Gemmataceae bacterium]
MKRKEVQAKRQQWAETKKAQALFAKYGTKLRDANTRVFHPVYQTWTECTPAQFAIYETAIKAIDAHYQALIRTKYVPRGSVLVLGQSNSDPDGEAEWLESYAETRAHHKEIAERDGFALADLEYEASEAYADYRTCCLALGSLYHDLLD